jgi:putative transposase
MLRRTEKLRQQYRTFGKSHAVRLSDYDYSQDVPTHLTLCGTRSMIAKAELARCICDNVEFYSAKLGFRLFGYCLMPDHLHVLLSPGESREPIGKWLDQFKSFTTHAYMRMGGRPPLWQRSAHDHVCRADESVRNVVMYIANNPVRAGLVEKWDS